MSVASLHTNSQIRPKTITLWGGQWVGSLLTFGTILFLTTERINWTEGRAYLGLNALTQLMSAIILIPRLPEILAERSQGRQGTISWNRFLVQAVGILIPIAILVMAGVEAQFGWSTVIEAFLWITSYALAFGFQLFVLWAVASNPFFATTARIKSDRSHQVVRRDLYGLVHHPDYLVAVVFFLVFPVVLGSWRAFILSPLTNFLILVLIHLEDQSLQTELPGYQEHASVVGYRLIPGIW